MEILKDSHLMSVRTLAELNQIVDACPRCATIGNPLQHVYGGGATVTPNFCFVLINPTYRNLCAAPSYSGPRFPFLGIKPFWRVLHQSGFFGDDALSLVERSPWDENTTSAVLNELTNQGIYLTNLVKCAHYHSASPKRGVWREELPLLIKEMELVRPKRIVAFGQITFAALTAQKIRLRDHHRQVLRSGITETSYFRGDAFLGIPIFPNFFPVGRGNQRLSAELLSLFRNDFSSGGHGQMHSGASAEIVD